MKFQDCLHCMKCYEQPNTVQLHVFECGHLYCERCKEHGK